mmetsp:Transcript_27964/g.90266  ORF Transcript_27964/g.90266 Transcript_27964/m.90266 type:complete len:300 (-) Transcript_27964:282-1181(-)
MHTSAHAHDRLGRRLRGQARDGDVGRPRHVARKHHCFHRNERRVQRAPRDVQKHSPTLRVRLVAQHQRLKQPERLRVAHRDRAAARAQSQVWIGGGGAREVGDEGNCGEEEAAVRAALLAQRHRPAAAVRRHIVHEQRVLHKHRRPRALRVHRAALARRVSQKGARAVQRVVRRRRTRGSRPELHHLATSYVHERPVAHVDGSALQRCLCGVVRKERAQNDDLGQRHRQRLELQLRLQHCDRAAATQRHGSERAGRGQREAVVGEQAAGHGELRGDDGHGPDLRLAVGVVGDVDCLHVD